MRRIALLGLLAVGCGPVAAVDSEVAIKGGSNVAATDSIYTHTVAVGDVSRPYCSGTVIAPDLVLTAAHCVTDDASDHSRRAAVRTTKLLATAAAAAAAVSVARCSQQSRRPHST